MSKLVKLIRAINSKMTKQPKVALAIAKLLPSNKYLYGITYRKLLKTIDFNSKPQVELLIKSVNFSINNSKFYKTKYKNVTINSIEAFENNIGFILKEDLVVNGDDLKTNKFTESQYDIVTTGGTSGPPTKMYLSKNRYKKEYAFFHKIWATKGYNGQLRGVIRNLKLPDGIVFKINPITREVVFDGFRNDIDYLKKIYQTLLKYKIEYLQCYPSSAYYFARIAHQENWDLSFLKGIFLSSEKYLDYQIKLLKETINLPVISVYGHSEKLVLAVDFDGNGHYKVLNDYGYFELIDSDNQVIKKVGQIGEIIGTTIDNCGQPLVRYKTGDFSSYLKYEENGERILNGIEGRWHGMKIYKNDGTYVTPTALNLHDELYLYIQGMQYYQPKMGFLEIRIIPGESYNSEIEQIFYEHFKNRLDSQTEIIITHVEQLSKNKNGKFLLLETEIDF